MKDGRANGPNPRLYGWYRLVSVIVSSVRPWNAPSKQTTPGLPVNARANLIAFSTASAPELKSATLRSPPPHSPTRRSASST